MTLRHLNELPQFAMNLGLERIQSALERLNEPHLRFGAVHIAGTNGKGSTCAMLAACLGQRYSTGLYTSPHLASPTERIRVNGEDIALPDLESQLDEVVTRLGSHHGLSYFELMTATAFCHFAKRGIDIAVLETGLGGRLDATNACVPTLTCITSLDMDHREHLGTSLASIAREKAGIIKRGIPVVTCTQPEDAAFEIEHTARARDAPLLREGRAYSIDATGFVGTNLTIPKVAPPLKGAHQWQNLGLALGCLDALRGRGFQLSSAQVIAGLAATRWAGRLEEVPGTPRIILDGAHNPAGASALAAAIATEYPKSKVVLIFGALADKDVQAMLEVLLPCATQMTLTRVGNSRSFNPAAFVGQVRAAGVALGVADSLTAALVQARLACPNDGVVVVAGSLFLVGEARAALGLAHAGTA